MILWIDQFYLYTNRSKGKRKELIERKNRRRKSKESKARRKIEKEA